MTLDRALDIGFRLVLGGVSDAALIAMGVDWWFAIPVTAFMLWPQHKDPE